MGLIHKCKCKCKSFYPFVITVMILFIVGITVTWGVFYKDYRDDDKNNRLTDCVYKPMYGSEVFDLVTKKFDTIINYEIRCVRDNKEYQCNDIANSHYVPKGACIVLNNNCSMHAYTNNDCASNF